MKFFPRFEMQCGVCGYVVWSRVADAGKLEVRCTNRGCASHGKRYVLQVDGIEGEEVLADAGGEDHDSGHTLRGGA